MTNPPTITKNYTENVGTPYTTTVLTASETPAGYRFVKGRDPVNASGTYELTHTVVEYYYEPISVVGPGQGTVTVIHTIHHTDGTVTVYKTEVPFINDIDVSYTSTPVNIPGYTLKEVPGNHDGKITSTPQTVTNVYVPNPTEAQLVEKHIILDAAGNVVGEVELPKVTVNPDGTSYITFPKPPAGYDLVVSKAPANPSGTYKTGVEQIVTYYYAPIVTPPTNPGGNTDGGWSSGSGSTGSSRPDVSPNVARITGVATTLPEEGDPLNPQTGDTTNQVQTLTALYVLFGVSVVAFVASLVIPRKRKKKRLKGNSIELKSPLRFSLERSGLFYVSFSSSPFSGGLKSANCSPKNAGRHGCRSEYSNTPIYRIEYSNNAS